MQTVIGESSSIDIDNVTGEIYGFDVDQATVTEEADWWNVSLWAVLTSNNLGLLNPYLGPATRGGVDMGWATFAHPTLSLGQAASQYIRSAGVPTTIEASGATADITDLPPLTSAGLVNDHCGQLIFVPDFKWPALGADITQDIKTLFYGIGGSTSNLLHIYGRVSTGTIVLDWVGNGVPSTIETDPLEFGWGDVVDFLSL